MRIQHNIPAMNAYRNYTANTSKLSKNLEKLSSGYKINRAGDDAAGLAISEKMRVQITGLEQAQSNAKSGINLIQTAEGALTEVHDMLNRMYTLAEQSANGTYDNAVDRAQLQKEVDALRTEINRIADSANFNGIKLLDGSMTSGAKVDNFKSVSVGNSGSTTATLRTMVDATPSKTAANGKYEINLHDATWTNTAATAGSIKMTFGGMTLTVAVAAGGSVTGDQVANMFADAVNQGVNNPTGSGYTSTYTADPSGNFVVGAKQFTVTAKDGVITFNGVDDKTILNATTTTADTTVKFVGDKVTNAQTDKNTGNQGVPAGWSMIEEPVSGSSVLLAQARLKVSDLNIVDGTTLKIGDTQYTFAVGKNSQFKDAKNVVDLTDMECARTGTAYTMTGQDWAKITSRLSQAANDNAYVQVESANAPDTAVSMAPGASNGATPRPSTTEADYVYLTEKAGGPAREEYDLFGKNYDTNDANTSMDASWKDKNGQCMIQVGQAKRTGTKLTLQIGDTAESFNKMGVDISDMHAAAMGIGNIDISTQDGASAAMKAIKNAVNYVSDVRGGLGALQNRLDHTINNLGVMQENIQDAESNIRDVDVAKEMMAYTKNNILVQSAQAMLAQANQLPQGVLQLLG